MSRIAPTHEIENLPEKHNQLSVERQIDFYKCVGTTASIRKQLAHYQMNYELEGMKIQSHMPWTPSIVSYWKAIVSLSTFLFVAFTLYSTAHMPIQYLVLALAGMFLTYKANRI